jgi:hypothetical protein
MKKVLTIAASVLLTSAVFYSCGLLKSLEEVKKSGFICAYYPPDQLNTMDKQTVLDMLKNYYSHQYNAIQNSNLKVSFPQSGCGEDSRAVFFSLDSLKNNNLFR